MVRPTKGLLQSCWCIGWTGRDDVRCDKDLPWGQKKLAPISPSPDNFSEFWGASDIII